MKSKKPKKSILNYLTPFDVEFVSNDKFGDDISESFGYLAHSKKTEKKFLNRFTGDDIINLMDKAGLTEHLNSKGFENIIPEIDRDEALVYYLKIYNNSVFPDNLLIDLRLSETRLIPETSFFENGKILSTLDMIVIEWLTLQNPNSNFSYEKPQLPGQRNPGLGGLKYMIDMMYMVAREVIKDGFLDIPDHIHGAIMYSKNFHFFNPIHEAISKAILRDLKGYSLIDISWGITTKTVMEVSTGKSLEYKPSEQIYPVSSRLQEYFNSEKYNDTFKSVYKKKKFSLDFEKMLILREEILKSKNLVDL